MKRSISCSIFALAVLSAAAVAGVDDSQFIVSTSSAQVVNNTPGLLSSKKTANGVYSVIKVSNSQLANARAYWQNAGLTYYEDKVMTRAVALGANQISGQSIRAAAVYNDPLMASQASLNDPVTAYAKGISMIREVKVRPKVAVLDAGVNAHEDFSIKAGYSFTTLYNETENDNYRPEVTNNGSSCKSAHGNAMVGIIGAKRSNQIGITGLADADIYVGRVMSTNCSTGEDEGLISDLYNGLNWAIGNHQTQRLPQVDVINISLLADLPCPVVVQEAINEAALKGISVVVAAGNYSEQLTARYMPANCEGVMVVGAHDADHKYAAYSNQGSEISFSTHGTYLTTDVEFNSAQKSIYYNVTGTSASAAAASAFIANIVSNFPGTTPEKIKKIMEISTIGPQSDCSKPLCGNGPLNAEKMVNTAEHLLDPEITFEHAFAEDSCQINKKESALSSLVNICGAYHVKVSSDYASLGNTYNVKIVRKPLTHAAQGWDSPSVEILSDHEITSNEEVLGLTGADFSKYDYAAAACYEGNCPFPLQISQTDAGTPQSCIVN